jgi:hypothetical protein
MAAFDTHPVTAGAVGTTLTLLLAVVSPPSVAIGVGAVAVATVVWNVDGYRQYAWAGTVFVLLTGLLLRVTPTSTSAYEQTAAVSLVGFGLLSLSVLIARVAVRAMGDRALYRVTDARSREELSRTTSSVLGTLTVAWGFIRLKERIARSGVIGVLAPVTFLLDTVGISVEIPGFWLLTDGIDMVLLTFVGVVVVGFHTLSSWHAFFRLRKTETAQAVGERAGQTAEAARTRSRTVADSSRDRLSKTVDDVDADDIVAATRERSDALAGRARERASDLSSAARQRNEDPASPNTTDRLGQFVSTIAQTADRSTRQDPEHRQEAPQQSGQRDPHARREQQPPSRQNDSSVQRESSRYCASCGTALHPDSGLCPTCDGDTSSPR